MKVVVRFRRNGEFVEQPNSNDLKRTAARYVQAVVNQRFGDQFVVTVPVEEQDETHHASRNTAKLAVA